MTMMNDRVRTFLRVALRVKLAARPKLPTLWWENEAGDRWQAPADDPFAAPPAGYVYQHSRFPGILRTNVLRMVQQVEVDACPHPVEAIKPDLGLIEGLEGRECTQCHGTQVKDAGAPWPLKWEAYGSRQFMAFESSWPEALVLAMVRPSAEELRIAIERHGEEPRLLGMDDAIILAATSCERCLNALLWRYGCDDGYPPFSPQWDQCNTKCAICETPGVWGWLLKEKNITQRTRQDLKSGEHYTEICRECGAVMGQCRCHSPDKVILYGVCDACAGKTASTSAERVADGYLEALTPRQRGWEKRREKDDFAEQNIPPEHLTLWRKLKTQFKGTPHERAEQFMEYLEEHPGESDVMLQQHADKDVAKLVREQEKERREQVKVEKECDKNQTKYENAWYAEQERATREKNKLKQLKERAEAVCQNCPTCDHGGGGSSADTWVPFAASASLHTAACPVRNVYLEHAELLMHNEKQAAMVERVAARYKQKKQVESEKGGKTTVYVYSERQIARRNAEKAKRLESLRKSIGNLRTKVKRDLKSSEPERQLTALAVALIDHTYERVGNEESAKERKHYGVTSWRKRHVSFGKDHATIKYTGKSGVQQHKKVTDKTILTALRNAYEACDDDGGLFDHDDIGKVTPEKINAYLEPFNVSAKDLRGFHANREMQERLKAVRDKAGALPEDKKAREKQLKEEFKAALEETAEAVGHEASTLKSQYLVPGLESTFLKDGTVMSKMKAAAYPFEPGLPSYDDCGDDCVCDCVSDYTYGRI